MRWRGRGSLWENHFSCWFLFLHSFHSADLNKSEIFWDCCGQFGEFMELLLALWYVCFQSDQCSQSKFLFNAPQEFHVPCSRSQFPLRKVLRIKEVATIENYETHSQHEKTVLIFGPLLGFRSKIQAWILVSNYGHKLLRYWNLNQTRLKFLSLCLLTRFFPSTSISRWKKCCF